MDGGRVGILALQGSVEPHRHALADVGVEAEEVRDVSALERVERLILPGGESTTLWRLLRLFGLWDRLGERGRDGSIALFGTCAGAILLGRGESEDPPPRLDLVDIEVRRNAYGRQVDSFVGTVDLTEFLGGGTGEGVFIRAPRFGAPGPAVEVVARREDEVVAVRQHRVLLSAYHPELASDRSLHRAFLCL